MRKMYVQYMWLWGIFKSTALKQSVGFHHDSPDGFDVTERSLHEPSINWFLKHFHWGLAFMGTWPLHCVIVFDSSMTLDSLWKKEEGKRVESSGGKRVTVKGCWAIDGLVCPTSCVSFSHRVVIRTWWGDFKRRPWISLPWSQVSDLNCLWNHIVSRGCICLEKYSLKLS